MTSPGRAPTSTYRLQITASFDLDAATDVLPYLHDLGVGWVYLSPLLRAEPGSDHGYDVVDHALVDPSRGGADGLERLSAEAHRLGMGVLVDLVPNHMGVASPDVNAAWWDLLEHGPASAYADWFDVDWGAGGGKVLVPVVGEGDEGSIEVGPTGVTYHEHRFPLAPGTSTLAAQHYALVDWRRGDAELNYRRFFTVTTLAGLRVEDPVVFDATHAEVRRWFDEGLVDGLRIDHPDGLRDPAGYLDRLAELTGSSYTLVEKILEPGEELERGWATDGTTGYDVLGLIDRVLTDPAGVPALERLDASLRARSSAVTSGRSSPTEPRRGRTSRPGEPTADRDRLGATARWSDLVHARKRHVADTALLAETRRIVRELPDGLADHDVLTDAVAEVLTSFPVYRSYLPAGRAHLDTALALAEQARPELAETLAALAAVLADPAQPAALRFQQTSGMVMAKGVEDSAFYRWSALTSLTEVGGDPSQLSLTPAGLHAQMARRQAEWPDAMTALSTHDTKRSEDVRARIAVLAETPETWESALTRLLELAPLPGPGFGNLLWQAAYGAWPLSRERLHAYAEKAMREAAEVTTWTDVDEEYEDTVHAAVDAAYDVPEVTAVLDDLLRRLGPAGESNALAAKLLCLTLPGVPDVYQGSELGDLSLVDPDNRRPVDFAAAATALAAGENTKQRVAAAALRLRRDRPDLLSGYSPVAATGAAADHLVGFDRGGLITLVTRLPLGLAAVGGWGDTAVDLPDGTWRDALGGAVVSGSARVTDVLGDSPVALLVRES
ncbi:malto-oligosyltrehalose synthase [Marmoricola endophyticus]|uniref:Malto-oligosyltrehalose synthase n=1 Tax=Marmoricola endophyticus TaxID=2040280 RepID=A0A917EZJ0_9ACTN|nr:malto-oligosyltrehalose synthase [Marmoricola endophyticus]GGF33879.1 malto-oligosyltrehalose synthase [Marmoricola endophyticus]